VLTGDFDGFGLLQWNTRNGSLQRRLTELMRSHSSNFRSVFGPDAAAMRQALTQPKKQNEQAFIRSLHTRDRKGLATRWPAHLKRLGADPEFQAIQVRIARTAMDLARAQMGRLGLTSERGLAYIFDIITWSDFDWLPDGRFKRIQQRVAAERAKIGGPLTELQLLEVIANVVADTTKGTNQQFVRARGMRFVWGTTTPFLLIAMEPQGDGPITDKRDPASHSLVDWPAGGAEFVRLHILAGQALSALQAEAAKASFPGNPFRADTGYVSLTEQKRNFDRAVKKYGSPAEARKWEFPPGTSPHQSGRAIDFFLGGKHVSANVPSLRQSAAYKWLVANAVRFGFYPNTPAPWHWEYNPQPMR
jgi:hypothetical protein